MERRITLNDKTMKKKNRNNNFPEKKSPGIFEPTGKSDTGTGGNQQKSDGFNPQI
jgi:hypothetical protein